MAFLIIGQNPYMRVLTHLNPLGTNGHSHTAGNFPKMFKWVKVPMGVAGVYLATYVSLASYPGLLTPAFVACSTNVSTALLGIP